MRTQSPPPKRRQSPSPIFGLFLLWTNGWMHQDATCTEVCLCPGDFVLDGDPAPFPKKGGVPNFRPTSILTKGCMDQDATWYRTTDAGLGLADSGVRWGPSSPPLKEHSPQFSANVRCGQTAIWTKMPLGMEVGLVPGDFVLDGDPAPPQKGDSPNFRPMSIAAKRLHGLRCHLVRR